MKKSYLIFTLVFVLIILAGCGFQGKEAMEKLRFVEYTIIKPTKNETTQEFFGYIKAGGEAELGFETDGVIKKIYFTDGDSVKKGETIAVVDNELNELSKKEALAALQDAYVQFENAKSYFERIDKLHAVGGISDNDWDKARTNMKSGKNKIKIAKEKLEAAGKRAGYGEIKAPADGIILKKLAEENQYTTPGRAIVVFQDKRNTEAKIFIAQKYINKVQTGTIVEIRADGILKERKKAKIKNITKTSVEEGVYRATIEFDKNYSELKDGVAIRAYIDFEPDNEEEIIKIPLSSVVQDEISSYVWVLEDIKENSEFKTAKIKRRDIFTEDIRENAAVVKGLRAGEAIIIKGTEEVMEGQRVKIKAGE